MKCEKQCVFYLFALLCLYNALAAPSEKRPKGKNKDDPLNTRIFMQAEQPGDEKDPWWPTLEVGGNRVDEESDYKDEEASRKKANDAKLEAKQREKAAKLAAEHDKKSNESNFKTICEDNNSGNCANKEKGINEPENTIEQVLQKISEVINKDNQILVKDVSELRRLINKLRELVKKMQKDKDDCPKCQGKIAEIEERRTVERKVLHSKEHIDQTKTEHAAPPMHLPSPPSPLPVPQPPSSPPPPPPAEPKKTESPPASQPQAQPTVGDPNFIKNLVPDVNYNGGIERSMDIMKQEYPPGYWPPEAEAGDAKVLNSDHNKGSESEKDYEINPNYKYTTVNVLDPKYLEAIIRREQDHLKRQQTNKLLEGQHHVQVHKIAVRNHVIHSRTNSKIPPSAKQPQHVLAK